MPIHCFKNPVREIKKEQRRVCFGREDEGTVLANVLSSKVISQSEQLKSVGG